MIAVSHAREWLAAQCRLLDARARGAVFLGEPDSGAYPLAVSWPDDFSASVLMNQLVQTAIARREILFASPPASEAAADIDVVAAPITVDGKLHGIVALELPHGNDVQRQMVTAMLMFGIGWLTQAPAQRQAPPAGATLALEMAATVLGARSSRAAATSLVTELATRLDAERVALGLVRDGSLRLVALSHSATFAERHGLARKLEAAMSEALDREVTICHPRPEGATAPAALAHAELAKHEGSHSIITLPLHRDKQLMGALTIERGAQHPSFDETTVQLAEQLAALAAPLLDLRVHEERGAVSLAREHLRDTLQKFFGPGHLTWKLSGSIASLLLVVLLVVPGEYRVTADAQLEGRIERVISAPQKGFLQSVAVRPGDVVTNEQLLAMLDDRDAKLEQIKWAAKREQVSREYRQAMAIRDRAQIGILGAQLEQADAQLELAEKQLSRLSLTAPFDGVVVSGDFSQSLGVPVERGQVLFKLAPLDGYRVILKVSEGDIAAVREGQRGKLTLAAAPGDALAVVIEKITPVATADAEGNHFRVEAKVVQAAPLYLRPGMKGVSKINAGQRQLIWIWTHTATDWLRVKLWSWWP
jgi:multidrug resistance efflux pump